MSQSRKRSRSRLFGPITSLRSSERVADSIRQHIVDGKLGPGELLPPERTLAERFRVTRNTVREALRHLEQLRVVAIRQGSGVTVQDYLTNAGVEFLVFLLRSDRSRGPLLRDVLEARAIIGEAICRRSIDTFDLSGIDELRAAVDAFIAEAHNPKLDPRTLQELEFDMHSCLIRNGGNQAFVLMHNSVRHVYEHVAQLFEHLVADRPAELADHYRIAIDALARGDRDTAKAAFTAVFTHET